MNLELVFGPTANARPVRVGIIGAGDFGKSFIVQAPRCPGVSLVAVCDRDTKRALTVLANAGFAREAIAVHDAQGAAQAAIEQGKVVLVDDPSLLVRLSLDVVVEATGDPATAVSTILASIEHGHHTVVATKEAEIVVGSILARKAAAAGVVCTLTAGDQPSILVSLIARARLLGLKFVAAGNSSRDDIVWNPETGFATFGFRSQPAPAYRSAFAPAKWNAEAAAGGRRLDPQPQPAVADLCELGVVANHTDLVPSCPELHGPIVHPREIPEIFRPKADGGMLERAPALDVFFCMRRPDELSFAGGTFVVVEAPNADIGHSFADHGMPASADRRHLMLHCPVHMLGVEAQLSVLAAARLRLPTGATDVRARFDMVARTRRDFAAGEKLTLGGGYRHGVSPHSDMHAIEGFEGLLLPAQALGPDSPVPYYLAVGRTLRMPVRRGEMLACKHVALDDDSTMLRLRREQDALFFPQAATARARELVR
jgi:predicted homoserine dehydrogenase-like protein